jgi:hypothetical protein
MSCAAFLAKLDVVSFTEVECLRGGDETTALLGAVRARLVGKGKGALIAEGERVVGRLAGRRGRLWWF